MLGFAAGSVFLSRARFDLFYHLIGISVALTVATSTAEDRDWSRLRRFLDPSLRARGPMEGAGAA